MKKLLVLLVFFVFYNCSENEKNTATIEKAKAHHENTANRVATNHLYVEIDDKKYDFYYDKKNLEIVLTTSYGSSGYIFNYDQTMDLVKNINTNSLSASYGSDFNMDIRNMIFNDTIITFDEYRNDTFFKNKTVKVSEKINKNDFFNSLDSTISLDNESIKDQLNLKACPPCVVLLIIVAGTVVSDSNEGNQDLCAQQNALVAANCVNRDGYCLESNGPCVIKCVPCPLTNP
ncbi:hypothetical protein SAMN04487989_102237 [Bizionia echini]|uniref:Uncharacterized protein n=1 Tax=Bizionia echini TaxID=649333 RepID=A0A1I5ARR1_9FLAO|nr:hypothetical protein [Bizionia echini]SFN65080.1 hypothetical protein SAMN04487989_102237 [Bizionia echini]